MPELTPASQTSVRVGGLSLHIDFKDVELFVGQDGSQSKQGQLRQGPDPENQKRHDPSQKDGDDGSKGSEDSDAAADDEKAEDGADSGEKKKKSDPKEDDRKKQEDERKKKARSRLVFIILGVIVLLIAIGALIYWLLTRNLIDTDDAYTEGRSISMAAKVAGYGTALYVNDNTFVKAGDLLLKIDQRDYLTARDQSRANLTLAQAQLSSAQVELTMARVRYPANLKQARAQLEQARANRENAKREYDRQHRVDARATSESNVDQATASFRSNNSQVESAEAQLEVSALVRENIEDAEDTVHQREAQLAQMEAALAQAEVNLSYTEIRAPQDGYITLRNVELGTFIQVGQQLFYIVPPETWVVANFKEEQLERMRPGQPVDMKVDAYPNMRLHGHVDSIQQGSGARFSAFPAQNATGNFVKIVRRVPVKVIVDSGYDRQLGLPLGLSVRPTVNVQ